MKNQPFGRWVRKLLNVRLGVKFEYFTDMELGDKEKSLKKEKRKLRYMYYGLTAIGIVLSLLIRRCSV